MAVSFRIINMKNKIMLTYLISLVHLLVLSSCNQKAEPETYLVPEGFTGKVNIIFNRKEGIEKKYEDGRRIYEIPNDGILLTQFTTNDGIMDRKYYYKNQSGELKLLKSLEADTTATDKNEIGIFLNGISGVYGNSGEPSALEYQEFLVSSYNLKDSFFTDDYKKIFYKRIEKISGLKQ
jgi:hypothetical protein